MTTRNLKIVESDLSGKADATTVTFGVAGTWYEIDLTKDEEEVFEQALQAYLRAGRKATPYKEAKPKLVPQTTPEQREAIRKWAAEQGFEFADRGRIPKKIIAAYEAKFGKLEPDS